MLFSKNESMYSLREFLFLFFAASLIFGCTQRADKKSETLTFIQARDLLNSEDSREQLIGFDAIKKLAQGGNKDAIFSMGLLHFKGEYVKKDQRKAIKFYEQAADKGSVEAKHLLSIMNLNGCMGKANPELAEKLKNEARISANEEQIQTMDQIDREMVKHNVCRKLGFSDDDLKKLTNSLKNIAQQNSIDIKLIPFENKKLTKSEYKEQESCLDGEEKTLHNQQYCKCVVLNSPSKDQFKTLDALEQFSLLSSLHDACFCKAGSDVTADGSPCPSSF